MVFRGSPAGRSSGSPRWAAWLDYDNDGFLDIFFTNLRPHPNALFRNNGDGTFTDVAEQAGVRSRAGHSGVVAADFDNDGFKDLLVTGESILVDAGPVILYHNNQDGTFTDISEQAGLIEPFRLVTQTGSPRRGADGGADDAPDEAFVYQTTGSAAVADIDNDGFLDLFIAGIGNLPLPRQDPNKLFRNNGDGTFTDISAAAGIDTEMGACAVLFADYDDDGWTDLFVANCNLVCAPTPIELFRNNGDLTFTDVRVEAGLDIGGFWMALAPADYDNDGDLDFFATNIGGTSNRQHALFENQGDGTFRNVSSAAGVIGLEFGWGATFTDFDNDGYADIFFAGSFPPGNIGPGAGNPGRLLFSNHDGTFTDASAKPVPGTVGGGVTRRRGGGGEDSTDEPEAPAPSVPAIPVDLSGRITSGVARADYDNDGFVDIVIVTDPYEGETSCRPVLLHNAGNANRSVTIRLVGTTSNRDAVGARVVVTAGDLTQTKRIFAGSSFLSSESPWLTFGLAEHDGTDRVEVTWPSGLVEVFPNIAARQTVTLVEGQGTVETVGPELIGVVDAAGDTWISPLGESVGLSSFRIEASEALQLRGDPQVVVTGGATPVVSLVSEGDGVHVVELDPAPEPGQWVKITLPVTGEVSGGEADLTVWVAHHPGDLNQDGNVNIADATGFGELFRAGGPLTLADLNGDGAIDVRDATAFGGIWFGTASTRPWNGSRLPDRP